jgi:hypothetical protein
MPNVVALQDRGDARAIIKGPATDASMITRMKRQAAISNDLKNHPAGRKGTGAIVDGQHIRGFQENGVRVGLINYGAGLGFFRVN